MRRFKVAFSIVMVIFMLMTSVAFAAPKEGVIYTALGDSIAFGTGGTGGVGYTDYFNEHLTRIYGEGVYLKLAQNGLTSSDLLGSLSDTDDAYGVQAAVGASNVITVSIGGNDLLSPFLEAFGTLVIENYYIYPSGIDIQSLMADLEGWQENPSDPAYTHFNVLLADLEVTFISAVEEFGLINWPSIIQNLRTINPSADIYVNTVYNPFVNVPILHDAVDIFVQGLNTSIKGYSGIYGYKVVDVYSKFEEYGNPIKLAVGDLSNLAEFTTNPSTVPVPLHPTDMGYKLIFNMHKDLMR
ncbi:SGNH/GDSL hydrolase family protein [Alkalibacter mobilis]|uniref:SGNH/GDSL hydrolase family protein n=1 Tax=Alkalibacter mobilis TaxID=2787712 RepID=UPI0018A114B5|nr:SGNH/GDSL hydrolase family protein [Alkalibacter mobilis]MBF7097549.1 SGNH/GDSL hydrolase family protein [Alkalibacter mobilis]